MAVAAGWAVIALLACVAMVVDNSLDSGPHAPLWLFVLTLATSVPALVGAAFGVADAPAETSADLLGRVGPRVRAGVLLATLIGVGVLIAGMAHNPPGNSARRPDGSYVLKFRQPPSKVVGYDRWRANSRGERRVFLGVAILVDAWGGAACWAVKLRDDEEDPL
ncbi:hypothetical protein GCM10010172_04720 [Paractinoplanes ferrugineus]|uniref:Uncharacterized protein n=1 Tax=Paractinoplanes ferrugineus TaxID=113564 RepID=A0A919J0R6_9ACTN|nr:hypothetical protein [Actinoplanes ferrugineus]GIE12611.1 hypothetical protein Afe05nite_44510 [Actinoplanes ferrugineus]